MLSINEVYVVKPDIISITKCRIWRQFKVGSSQGNLSHLNKEDGLSFSCIRNVLSVAELLNKYKSHNHRDHKSKYKWGADILLFVKILCPRQSCRMYQLLRSLSQPEIHLYEIHSGYWNIWFLNSNLYKLMFYVGEINMAFSFPTQIHICIPLQTCSFRVKFTSILHPNNKNSFNFRFYS